jgi:hypothetical protein
LPHSFQASVQYNFFFIFSDRKSIVNGIGQQQLDRTYIRSSVSYTQIVNSKENNETNLVFTQNRMDVFLKAIECEEEACASTTNVQQVASMAPAAPCISFEKPPPQVHIL